MFMENISSNALDLAGFHPEMITEKENNVEYLKQSVRRRCRSCP